MSQVYRGTKALVGVLLALGGAFITFKLVSPVWGILCSLLGAYEFWTLVNKESQDTISEAIWDYAKHPVFVASTSLGVGYAIRSGYLGDPIVVVRAFLLGALAGHFYFQKYRSR